MLRARLSRMRLPALQQLSLRVDARLYRGPVGGAGVGIGGVLSGFPVVGQCSFTQGGPKDSRWIHSTAKGTGQADERSAAGGHVPSNPGAATFSIHTR